MPAPEYILGIDYGGRRIGLALVHQVARLPHPHTTIPNDEQALNRIRAVVQEEHVGRIVVGVPRNMDGTESDQSVECATFAKALAATTDVTVETYDETLSSVEAEQALQEIGKPYAREDIDAMAAALILERYVADESSGVQS